MKKAIIIATTLALLFNVSITPAHACSYANESYYTYTLHPDFPLDRFAAGQLGIVQPSYARSYLLVAYHYLAGKPLSRSDQEQMEQLWADRLDQSDSYCSADTSSWLKLRATVPGVSKIESIDVERPVSSEDQYQTYCNAQSSAFMVASATLQKLIDEFGINSKVVKEWVEAQDAVFSNCGAPRYSDKLPEVKIPEPLPEPADTIAKQLRQYQIAAAKFYAQKFDDARKDFEAIAQVKDHAMEDVSGYLAVRCMIRKATLAKEMDRQLLAQAGERVKQLLSAPGYAGWKGALEDLGGFVAVRLTPGEHLHYLLSKMFARFYVNEITKTIDYYIDKDNEGAEVNYGDAPDFLKKDDVYDWMITFQSKDKAGTDHAIEKWKTTKSLPWLVAAITRVEADNASAKQLLAAAQQEKSNVAKWMLFYHINRLKSEMKQADEVRASLDKVMAANPADLPPGSLNKLKSLRLPLSRNLDEFVSFGALRPLAICSDGGIPQLPDSKEEMEGKCITKVVFVPAAADVINNKMPLSMIRQLAANPKLPAGLRDDLVWRGWVRAVLIGDAAQAQAFALLSHPKNQAKQKLFTDFISAATPEMKKFAAVYLMLQYSSASPHFTSDEPSEDGYGDASGWWWFTSRVKSSSDEEEEGDDDDSHFDPIFITGAQKKQAASEAQRLSAAGAAPNYFAKTVLAFAKAHPADPRVPKALHFGVKSTRYGSTDDATQSLSKQMFTLLHTKYKGNTWTKQTPYWY